jgi:hypothetical protein
MPSTLYPTLDYISHFAFRISGGRFGGVDQQAHRQALIRAPYNKDLAASVAAKIRAQEKAKAKVEAKTAEATARTTSDRTENVSLREKVKRLEDLLEVEKQSKSMAVANAQLKAVHGTAEKLLARYRDGLRDGASLSRGGSLGVSTPDSAHMARAPGPDSDPE